MKGVLLILLLGLFLVPHSTQAASLYIDPNQSTINLADSVTVAVRLDTDESVNECVNAVEGVLTYDEGVFPVDISLGESIFSIWIEEPTINEAKREITFAGGIPNGYCGRIVGDPRLTNVLMTLVFRAPGFTVGESVTTHNQVGFTEQTKAYINDGLGTPAPLQTFPTTITVQPKIGSEIADPWSAMVQADTIAPEEFSVVLERDDLAFGGRYFIAFNTTDKQSGIDHYEVIEEPSVDLDVFNWGASDAPWIRTRSPYVLTDQTLNSVVRVKAVDKAGNEYIATLVPDESLRTTTPAQHFYTILTWVSVGAVVVLVLLLALLLYRYRRHRNDRDYANVSANNDDYGYDE